MHESHHGMRALLAVLILSLAACAKIAGLEDGELDPSYTGGGPDASSGGSGGAGHGGSAGAAGSRNAGGGSMAAGGSNATGGSSTGGAAPDGGTVSDASIDRDTGAGCSGLMCNGACVLNDVRNCGTCGHDCTTLPHVSGTVTCNAGRCGFAPTACAAPWGHCSSNPDDGCETDLSKPENCGACGTTCPAGTPVCAGSGSTFACATGCPASTPTLCSGSCVDTSQSTSHCAMCGHACTTTVVHAQPVCQNSMCSFTCNSGYSPCAGGCVNEQTDNNNCGGCGSIFACAGGKTCQSGRCACPAGMVDCNGTCQTIGPANGCGAGGLCKAACPGPTAGSGIATCNGTACAIACGSATPTLCGTTCVNTTNDAKNCNGCGKPCMGTEFCENSVCTCGPGKIDCGGDCQAPSTSNKCGTTCNASCPAAPMGGSSYCNGSSCATTCNGLTNCSNVCVDTTKDVGNCGGCAVECLPMLQNRLGVKCNASKCDYDLCLNYNSGSSYLDCDGNRSNGCEAAPNVNSSCGQCPSVCGAARWCNMQGVTVGDCLAVPGGTNCVAGGPFGFHCQGGG